MRQHSTRTLFTFVALLFCGILQPARLTQCQSLNTSRAVSYRSYYPSDSDRPNHCSVASRSKAVIQVHDNAYIPFLGTAMSQDTQLFGLRMFYSIDFPVKNFIIVTGRHAYTGRGALKYELRHLLHYAANVLFVVCEHAPSVAEGWNAVFQALPEEPWGVYAARDIIWTSGSLRNLSQHMWQAAARGGPDIGIVSWPNMDPTSALKATYNIFAITRQAVNRFGLFDEHIFPAFCEDYDFIVRQRVMVPPLIVQQFGDVEALHGSSHEKSYKSGTLLPDDLDSVSQVQALKRLAQQRLQSNCLYFRQKWGCSNTEYAYETCKYKTPFNASVPVWYWNTTKHARHSREHLMSTNPAL